MPYWRLSAYYFFYFASLGAIAPYWALYLEARGYDPWVIGQLMAILAGTKILAPLAWGVLVDRSGRRMPLVRLASWASALCFMGLWLSDDLMVLVLTMALFSFFWNASLPQLEAVTFNHLGARSAHYARIRIWGSVGFILVVVTLGWVLEQAPIDLVPIWILALLLAIAASTLAIPDRAPPLKAGAAPALRALLRRPTVQAFLAACFLMQLSHGTYYAFYSLLLESAHYSKTAIGGLWALGVVAEVVIFLVMHRLLPRFGARCVLLWSLALAVARWLLIGFYVDWWPLQILAQILHAATFGAFHAAAIHLVHGYFAGHTQGRGQALYNALGFGAGGVVGSLIGGWFWTAGGPAVVFGIAAGAAALGWWTVWRWVERPDKVISGKGSTGW